MNFSENSVPLESDHTFVPRALDFTGDDQDDDIIDYLKDRPWEPEPRARKSKTQLCRFPNTAAFAGRRNSGETEFTLWVNFVCMDLMPFFPGIEKHLMSVTKGKKCIEEGKKHALNEI